MEPVGTGALDGKVALVTGSSRGIGAAIAKRFAAAGAGVAVHGRDRTALAEVHDAIVRSGSRAIQVAADVTRFGEIEAMRERADVLGLAGDIRGIAGIDFELTADRGLEAAKLGPNGAEAGQINTRKGQQLES